MKRAAPVHMRTSTNGKILLPILNVSRDIQNQLSVYCNVTSTSTKPLPAGSELMAFPRIAPWDRL